LTMPVAKCDISSTPVIRVGALGAAGGEFPRQNVGGMGSSPAMGLSA